MGQYMSGVTPLSSKGQIVLPKAIRDALKIAPGTKLMAFSDGDSILLKPIPAPDISEFRSLMDKVSEWSGSVGMQEEDIADAVTTVRRRRKK